MSDGVKIGKRVYKKITFWYHGQKLSSRIEMGSPSMEYAGHYSMKRNVVKINPHYKNPVERDLIARHEVIERHLRKKHGLTYKQAHHLATVDELQHAKKHRVNWKKWGTKVWGLYERLKVKNGYSHKKNGKRKRKVY